MSGRTVGSRIGAYELMTPIGAGGMGEVWKARDTRLGRVVAIKFSQAQFTERVEREARSIAALNHPNICQIYDVGENYLVMEYVEGEPIRAPDNVRKLLDIAVQLADGLAAAHAAGFIHRDLKPSNILLTRDRRVKILDFGLAKQSATNTADETTRTFTHSGMVAGTAAYMSPEQACAQELDVRSDQFALGLILYELAAGRRAFQRESAAETMAAIIREDSPPLPASVPTPLQWVIERCLAKEPGGRYESTRDLYRELKTVLDHLSQVTTGAATSTRHTHRSGPLIAAGVLAALALFAGWWVRGWLRQPLTGAIQFQRITDFVGMEESPSIAPDEKTVAFVAPAAGRRQIWVRLLASGVPLQITHDDADHQEPRWSPDSSALIYYSPSTKQGEQGTIWEISALGGAPRRVVYSLGGGDISRDGRRVAAFQLHEGQTELVTVARDGSGIERIAQMADQHPYDRPRWSPDDRSIAFHRGIGYAFDEAICVAAATGGAVRELVRADGLKGLAWLPDGSGLVYSSSLGSTILYPPIFNLRTVRRDGSGERPLTFGEVSYVNPDMRSSGKLVASRIRIQSDIWKFPASGSPEENTKGAIRITRQTGQAQTPSASPEGTELVYLSDSGGHGNLWVTKTDGSDVRQITFERDQAAVVGIPTWSPAGGRIAFILTGKGETSLWLVNPDGGGVHQLVPRGSSATWSPDGRWLYYSVLRKAVFCIEKVPVSGGTPITVRCENSSPVSVTSDLTLYYANQIMGLNGGWDSELRRARPETGPSQILARVAGSRVPMDTAMFQPVLSPDGKTLVAPLSDGATSNLWAIPSEGGALRPLTDFGQRSILIARRISWSPDGKYIYAAVAETDADIVLLDGLVK
jgi:eukaryotic-like serine/threonine-protein kinase